jgi:hypothetical protein
MLSVSAQQLGIDVQLLRGFERAWKGPKARSQHLAALAERGLGEARYHLCIDALRLIRRDDVDHRRDDFRRRHEGRAVDVHRDPRV